MLFEMVLGVHARLHPANPEDAVHKIGDGPGRPLYVVSSVHPAIYRNSSDGPHCISVRMDKKTNAIHIDYKASDMNTLAWGCWTDKINQTGWGSLRIVGTNKDGTPLQVRAYTAGLVEGLLTGYRISEFSSNLRAVLQKEVTSAAARQAVERVIRMAIVAWEEFAGGDGGGEPKNDLPRQAWAALLQMRGIRDGVNMLASVGMAEEISAYDLMVINMNTELPALFDVFNHTDQAKNLEGLQGFLQLRSKQHKSGTNRPSSSEDWIRWAVHQPQGSAIVKRIGPRFHLEDLLVGHVTWGEYSQMMRMTKHYELYFGSLVHKLAMTSYPGCISSTDDYFFTDRKMMFVSTSLWLPPDGPHAKPPQTVEGLPNFLRATIATRVSTHPRVWAKAYAFVAGIAGGKQWLIVDYTKFEQGQPLANDTIWLVDSLPRVQRAGDISHIVQQNGFFAAYGEPHYRQMREIFGLDAKGLSSYKLHQKVALIDKGQTISSPAAARELLAEVVASRRTNVVPISPRYDLDPRHLAPIPAGAVDAKVASRCMVEAMSFQARSGPAIPPSGRIFQWTDERGEEAFPAWPHRGLPDTWNFSWVQASPGKVTPITTADTEDCTQSPYIL